MFCKAENQLPILGLRMEGRVMSDERKRHINDFTEYTALRDEMLTRINFINTYSNKTLTFIIALWAVGFTLVGVRVGIYLEGGYYLNRAFTFGESIAFFMVVPIVHSIVIKNDENIRQIASIGAYLRVFYECIPMVNQEETCFYWENVDASLNIVKTTNYVDNLKTENKVTRFIHRLGSFIEFYNWEYLFMAFASVVFWLISIISFLSIEGPKLNLLFIVSCVVFFVCFLQIIYSGYVILTRINTPKSFSNYYNKAVQSCIENAKKMDFIDDTGEEKINEMINEMSASDTGLEMKAVASERQGDKYTRIQQ